MLSDMIIQKERCFNCGKQLDDIDFLYRHKAPSGYICSNCGYSYINQE